jgi:CubicO group peptidase (beta-lactamase class C family)
MMKKSSRASVLLCGLMLALPLCAVAQSSDRDAVIEQRAKDFARALSSPDRAAWQKFWTENFAPGMLSIPAERHMAVFSRMWESSRGLDFDGIQDRGPNPTVVRFRNRLTGGWTAFGIATETDPPYRIVGLGPRPAIPPEGAGSRALSDRQIAGEMKNLMKRLAEADVFSGVVLLAKDGVPVFKGVYGIANKDTGTPNRLDTKFNLGSMNKMFTSVAILQLAERGKLSLEDPLSKFIPTFPDEASSQKIRIKHLLSHTAGLGSFFGKRFQESSRALYRTVDDMMKLAAADEKSVLFEPGTRHQYSNTGMLVLGKVIEVASGQSYYDYVRENIYKPAGMTNTDCYELDKVNENLAVGYDKQFTAGGVVFQNNVFAHVIRGGPHGGGYSTAEDLLRFERALRTNKLVKAESVRLLLSAKPELSSPAYGYGFAVDEKQGIAGHSGGFIGINSNLDLFLGTGWTAIVMSNYTDGGQPVVLRMRELVAARKP